MPQKVYIKKVPIGREKVSLPKEPAWPPIQPQEPPNLIAKIKHFLFSKKTTKFALIASIVFATFVFWESLKTQPQPIPAPQQTFLASPSISPNPASSPVVNTQVENIFKVDLPALDGKWALVVMNLKNGQTYNYNQNDVFQSASLYKLATMWTTFKSIEDGKLTKESTISGWNVEDALSAMITVSNNDAALALSEKLGWSSIQKLMIAEGFTSFDLTAKDSPKVNAKDVAKLLERIYTNTAVSKEASEQMKDLLFAQQINDRIPALLPKDVKVGHKTGEIDNFRHDAGIVLGKKGDYIFVFLAETTPEYAVSQIAKMSQKIYNALED